MREVSIPERTNLVNTHEMNPFFHKNYIDVVGTKICIRIRDTKKKKKKGCEQLLFLISMRCNQKKSIKFWILYFRYTISKRTKMFVARVNSESKDNAANLKTKYEIKKDVPEDGLRRLKIENWKLHQHWIRQLLWIFEALHSRALLHNANSFKNLLSPFMT